MSYQIVRDGKELGTFTEEELIDAVERGEVLITDQAWTEGMDEWEPVETLIEIEEVEEAGAPADPVPMPAPPVEAVIRPLGQAHATTRYSHHVASTAPEPERYGTPPPPMIRGSLYGSIPAGQYGPAGSAIASLVLGILSLVFSFLTGIPAILCGHAARKKIRRTGGAFSGHGMAVAGLVLGYVTSALGILAIVSYFCLNRSIISGLEDRFPPPPPPAGAPGLIPPPR